MKEALFGITVSRGESLFRHDYAQSGLDNMHVGAVSVTLCCFIDCVELAQHLRLVSEQSLLAPRCLMLRCKEVLAVNMWSSAQLTRPEGEPNPLQEPSVSPARLSIILTAALNLEFFCRQLQAAVNSFTCTCL